MSRSGVDDDDRSERPSRALPRVVQPLDLDVRSVALVTVAVVLVAVLVAVLTVRRLRSR